MAVIKMKKFLKVFCSLVLCCCMCISPVLALEPESNFDIPENAIVIYADSMEDARKQMDQYENLVIGEVQMEEIPSVARVDLTGIHMHIHVFSEGFPTISVNGELGYYYDTVADYPVDVYDEYMEYSDTIGVIVSTNNVHSKIVNRKYIQTDISVHFEYYIILEGIGKLFSENKDYIVSHNVSTGKVSITKN